MSRRYHLDKSGGRSVARGKVARNTPIFLHLLKRYFRHTINRLMLIAAVMLGATVLVFSLMRFAPGDPAAQIAIARYGLETVSEDLVAQIRVEEGLDDPIYVQYSKWLNRIVRGDLGRSMASGEPVLREIVRRLPATLELAVAATFISLFIAIPIGVLSAVKQYSIFDYLSMGAALMGVSMPNFWLAMLLVLVFSVKLGWLPVFGREGPAHLVLPAVTLGTGMSAIIARLTRSSMLEILSQDYIRTARAKGLPEMLVMRRHALKNALIPVVTVVGLQFAFLLEGAVIVETIFAWPGIGKFLVDSIYNRDFPVIQGCALFLAMLFAVVNFIVDVSYTYLDPRIRYEK
jgi:peptide/nickel transport system permease protein